MKEVHKEESSSMEKTLQEVISLPNVADVLDALSRWYNSSSEEDVCCCSFSSFLAPDSCGRFDDSRSVLPHAAS